MRHILTVLWPISLRLVGVVAVSSISAHVSASDVIVNDAVPPEIGAVAAPSEVTAGARALFDIEATDDVGVAAVTLHYRREPGAEFVAMPALQANDKHYRAEIGAGEIAGPVLNYYIEVRDVGGNTVMRGSAGMPSHVAVYMPPPPAEEFADRTVPSRKKTSYWKWVAGAVAVGAIASMAQSKSSSSGDPPSPGVSPANPTVTITGAPYPQP